jgi:hypothetical protein
MKVIKIGTNAQARIAQAWYAIPFTHNTMYTEISKVIVVGPRRSDVTAYGPAVHNV